MLWPLLSSRPDVVQLMFPRMSEIEFTPQVSQFFVYLINLCTMYVHAE